MVIAAYIILGEVKVISFLTVIMCVVIVVLFFKRSRMYLMLLEVRGPVSLTW